MTSDRPGESKQKHEKITGGQQNQAKNDGTLAPIAIIADKTASCIRIRSTSSPIPSVRPPNSTKEAQTSVPPLKGLSLAASERMCHRSEHDFVSSRP